MLSDEELLQYFMDRGETDYLGELYERYLHLVFGVCLKYLKNRENAKDAVIQIYTKIQEDIHRHDIRNFKSWLFVVVKNHCLMELRKQKNSGIFFLNDEKDFSQFMEIEPELHPLDKEEEISDKTLDDCIENLKPEQKKCINWFYFHNKCYREIAGLLEMAEKEVKSHLQNAKRNLKICLENKK